MSTITTAALDTVVGNVYQSSGNTAITFMSFCNYSTNDVTIDVHVVPQSGIAGQSNLIYSALLLTPNDTYQLYLGGEKLLLSNGDTVQAVANATSAVTVVTSFTSI